MFYLRQAYMEARKSRDLSTQNGALIVQAGAILASGHNDIPEMVCDQPERRDRPAKYNYTEHAERAAIYDAALHGISTRGATMSACWAACADCGRAIVMAGIKKLIRHHIPQHDLRPDWAASIAIADQMFREAGVEVVEHTGFLGETFLFNGEKITV